ncbi:uncharacterized protein LOC143078477 [Mytilus galloprovincialis]|uniref:uncharacterized protein LOC143078477 n=1 Tax=Mytilus galloprovincialis TaxID=29158 RepID=UPI003F7C2DDA
MYSAYIPLKVQQLCKSHERESSSGSPTSDRICENIPTERPPITTAPPDIGTTNKMEKGDDDSIPGGIVAVIVIVIVLVIIAVFIILYKRNERFNGHCHRLMEYFQCGFQCLGEAAPKFEAIPLNEPQAVEHSENKLQETRIVIDETRLSNGINGNRPPAANGAVGSNQNNHNNPRVSKTERNDTIPKHVSNEDDHLSSYSKLVINKDESESNIPTTVEETESRPPRKTEESDGFQSLPSSIYDEDRSGFGSSGHEADHSALNSHDRQTESITARQPYLPNNTTHMSKNEASTSTGNRPSSSLIEDLETMDTPPNESEKTPVFTTPAKKEKVIGLVQMNMIDHQGSPQRGYLQLVGGIFKKDKGMYKTEENELQDHLMSRKTSQFEEDDFIETKQILSAEVNTNDQTESVSNLQMHRNQYITVPINDEFVFNSKNQLVDPRRKSINRYQYVSPTHSTGSQTFSNSPNYLWSPAKSSNKIISIDKSEQSSNLQMKTVPSIAFLNLSEMESSQGPSIYQRPKENPTLTTKQSYLQLRTTHSKEIPAVLEAHSDKHSSLLTSPILCDGMYIDCITDKRLDTRAVFFSSAQDEDTNCLLSELEKTQSNEFACLVYTSHHLKTRKSLEFTVLNQLFRYSIRNGSSLMCRLILSFITYNVKAESYLIILIRMMFLALDKVEKDCARAISWFITRAFYLQYQSLLKELIDIWPSFCCPCSKRSKSSACSTEVVIVVELDNDCPQLPKQFCQLQIISIKIDDILSSEAPAVYNELINLNGSENVVVSSVVAKDLFTKHSKLTLICKSFKKLKGYKNGTLDYILNVPCVQLYCSAKGCIPIGEDHFPKDVCGLPTDILQGTPSLMANLKVGDKIGTDNYKMGTLGGFVKVRGDVCFLTCLHVFLSAEDLASDNISLDDDAGVIVKCYSTGSVTGQGQMIPYECGRIREIAFEMDNERETSIDAALITLNDRSQIDENDYLASGDITKAFAIRDLGMKSKYLNENCIDFKPLCYSIPCPKVEVVAVGAISGICNAEAQVKENNEKSIDLESIEQTFSNVILTELKEKVDQVIEQLKGQVHIITSDQICAIIGQVCDPSISDEFKSVILDIIKNILPKIIERLSQNGNTNTNNNHEDAIFCSTCAGLNQPMCMCFHGIIDEMVISKSTSRLSSIVSDVHMQRTFLRRTGDLQSLKRTSRRVYNQIHISNIPFKPGDSGTCIYAVQPSAGCIGMAIANHPQSGCIATPIKEILKHFKIKIK